jgi:transposase
MSHDLTDEQWVVIEPVIPKKQSKRGRPRNDARRTLNGILYVLKAGSAWEDMPKEDGSDSTCWRRLDEWSRDGMWERIWRTFLSQLDGEDKTEWAQAFLDGSFVPAKKGAME